MSTKATLKYASIDYFMIHIYQNSLLGYAIDIRIENHITTFPISKSECDLLIKQLDKT